jgi:DNA end-binding protein Ku
MARPVWSGVLTLGLVTVPVAMYSAVEEHTVRFHQLQRGTSDRVRNKRVNERTGKEVHYDDIVKGYEVAEGEYVVVETEELDKIAPGRSKVLEIDGFVDLSQVEPVYFGRTYHLLPRAKEYGKIYQVLRTALEKTDRVGIATFTMRNKEYLTALRAEPEALIVQILHWPDEVRDPREELPELPRRPGSGKDLDMALQLVDALAADWRPGDYRDTYEERVHALVEAKREGGEVREEAEAPEATNVVSLEEALQGSIDKAKASGSGRHRGPSRRGGRGGRPDFAGMTKDELYRRAADQNIAGRSRMSRAQLVKALREAAGRGGESSGAA